MGGRDKSRLLVGGQTILDRQAALLAPLVDEIVVIANDTARFADRPWRVVPDARPGTGVTGAIFTAIAAAGAAGAGRVLTIAGDMPGLTAALVASLLEIPDGADARWVRSAQGPEPLVSAWRTTAAAQLAAAIDAGHLRAGALADWLRIDVLDLGDAVVAARFGPASRLLANVNTPEDLASLE
jgi:molybdopterin-guanine dinucleotide biosynthesis protein A